VSHYNVGSLIRSVSDGVDRWMDIGIACSGRATNDYNSVYGYLGYNSGRGFETGVDWSEVDGSSGGPLVMIKRPRKG
jgi:hypothetical protein